MADRVAYYPIRIIQFPCSCTKYIVNMRYEVKEIQGNQRTAWNSGCKYWFLQQNIYTI